MDKITSINKDSYTKPVRQTVYHTDIENKKAWGRAGVSAIKDIAKELNAVAINVRHNPSGTIDRGYVSGFINKTDGTKTVYISINDGMQDILYRTAKHALDYTGGSNHTCRIDDEGFETIKKFITNYFQN